MLSNVMRALSALGVGALLAVWQYIQTMQAGTDFTADPITYIVVAAIAFVVGWLVKKFGPAPTA